MYSFSTNLIGDMDTIEQQVTNELKEKGFGVLTEIDVQSTLKMKLGIDKRPYKIIGAYNPPLVHEALQAEADIGLFLPCNVVLREEVDASITVYFLDLEVLLTLFKRDDIRELAKEVKSRLEKVKLQLEKANI